VQNSALAILRQPRKRFCCSRFQTHDLAKLSRGGWFAKVVVMSERSTEQIRELLDSLYRVDSGRILATLIRLLGGFDLAEEAMHEAFAGCVEPVAGEWSTR
jgi:hypothetical protein